MFQKPLNQYHYIPQFSNHPAHNLTGFIKGELIRYRRLSTLDNDYSFIKSKFYERLLKRGYTKNILNPIFFDQNLFQPKPPNNILSLELQQRFVEKEITTFNFVIRHNLQPQFSKLMQKQFDLLTSNLNTMQNQFFTTKIRISYKSNPNIKNLTTNSRLSIDKINLINDRMCG